MPGRTRARRPRWARAGNQLHEWVFGLAAWRKPHGQDGGEVNASTKVVEESLENIGATVMGRNMFGGEGPWGDDPWDGWWGDDPPFHMPVFIVTHHAREPVTKEGGTTFTFVTDGIASALEHAREAAGGKDVALGGGANVAQQYLKAGLIDEMQINVVPVLLGDGARGGRARVHPRGRGPRRHPRHLPRREVRLCAGLLAASRARSLRNVGTASHRE